MSEVSSIRLSPNGFECVGGEEFVERMTALYAPSFPTSITHKDDRDPELSHQPSAGSSVQATHKQSMVYIAARIKPKNGPELFMVACVYMTRDGQTTFTRQEILDVAKSAPQYYKETYRKHMSEHLDLLTKKGALLKQTDSTYAISDEACKEFESRLSAQE